MEWDEVVENLKEHEEAKRMEQEEHEEWEREQEEKRIEKEKRRKYMEYLKMKHLDPERAKKMESDYDFYKPEPKIKDPLKYNYYSRMSESVDKFNK